MANVRAMRIMVWTTESRPGTTGALLRFGFLESGVVHGNVILNGGETDIVIEVRAGLTPHERELHTVHIAIVSKSSLKDALAVVVNVRRIGPQQQTGLGGEIPSFHGPVAGKRLNHVRFL